MLNYFYQKKHKENSMKKFIFLLLGILYYFLIQTPIIDIKHTPDNTDSFTFTVQSYIPQTAKFHVGAGRYYFKSIECHKKKISFPKKSWQWFEGVGEQTIFKLQRGKNRCTAIVDNPKHAFQPIIKQKLTFINYIILFILIGIPLFSLLFTTFIWILDKLKGKIKSIPLSSYANQNSAIKLPLFIFIIFFLGIAIRIMYFQKFGIMNFQHDWQGHVEFIKYIATNWTLPLPSKGLEYPQQPLYYLITALIYTVSTKFGFSDMQALYHIGYFSVFCSIVFLYYGYKFLFLVTQNIWATSVGLLFLSFTPSIVYLSARINNDALVMALSALCLYYIVKSYKSNFKIDFYKALGSVSLLFITKISAAPMELLLFALLILVYLRTDKQTESFLLLSIQKKLYLFGLVGFFLLGFTLLRVYLPIENTFHMVNSSANFPGQIIKSLDWSYFGTFNIDSLIHKGYSYVFGADSIRYSFATYQYGTMFFGEFGYNSFIKSHEGLKEIMQGILLFGLVYVLGLISYIARLPHMSVLYKLLFTTLILNLLLIFKFMFSYPVICNTDFRYFVTSFLLFAFIFAQGLSYISFNRWIKYILTSIIGILSLLEILFFTLLLK